MNDYIKREDAIRTMAQYMMDMALIDNPEASDRIEQWEGSIAAPVMSTVKAADVVEADKAQKEIDYWHDKAQSYEQTILKLSLNKADVVEVVRCKDCKHRDTNECPYDTVNYMLAGWDFCSSGERADE